jgi:predicted component of type VI protein secretion system
MAYLVLEYGDTIIGEYEIDADCITIGSDSACTIAMRHDSVKPRHARIQRTGASRRIEALTPHAPILINGKPVTGGLLHDGDGVEIGGYTFRIYANKPAPAAPAEPAAQAHPPAATGAGAPSGLEDALIHIIRAQPFFSENDIHAALAQPEYGAFRIGRYKLRAALRHMGLSTRLKRYAYAKKHGWEASGPEPNA